MSRFHVIGGVAAATTGVHESYDPVANTWATHAPLSIPRFGHVAGSIDGRVFVTGGHSARRTPETEMFDPATGVWTSRAAMPTGLYGAAAAVSGGRLYVMGGQNPSDVNVATLHEYDPVANTWSATRNPMPQARRYLGAAAIGGSIFAVGGFTTANVGTTEEYVVATNTWTARAAFPSPRHLFGCAATNDHVYVFGGWTGSAVSNLCHCYSPSGNSWAAIANLPVARSHSAAARFPDGRLFVSAGMEAAANSARNDEYVIATNTWTQRANVPTARRGGAGAVILGEVPIIARASPMHGLMNVIGRRLIA